MEPFPERREPLSSTSASLLSRMGRGDEVAQEEFYRKYAPAMYNWCRNRWQLNHHDAEDVTEDLTVKLIVLMERFVYDPAKSFRAWLSTLTRRAAADFWRSRQRRKLESGAALDELVGDDNFAAQLEDVYYAIEFAEQVQPLCRPHDWKIFTMVVLDCLDPAEVARRLETSRGAVDTAKSRVRKILQREAERRRPEEMR